MFESVIFKIIIENHAVSFLFRACGIVVARLNFYYSKPI